MVNLRRKLGQRIGLDLTVYVDHIVRIVMVNSNRLFDVDLGSAILSRPSSAFEILFFVFYILTRNDMNELTAVYLLATTGVQSQLGVGILSRGYGNSQKTDETCCFLVDEAVF